ncbi:glutamine amidotransferase [Erwinia typographi]|uniref:Glutamine amidotransferase n=1 Tax=Erwinia typographi TaxID=371042 RepID=A0A0A3Z8E2_9GAMM|nr:type 1 glutamine amidotransferase [Erwinia typographi]KGT95120.1 glutamine amidotransferase [Erwinia typographi]
MKIGLLQCDDVAEALQPRHGNYPHLFQQAFSQVGSEVEWQVFRCHDGEIPQQINELDGWVISGSRHGVYDNLPWIDELGAFIRQCWQQRRPVVGICFGHQLLAQALGGTVKPHPQGWGIGVSFNQIVESRAWMQPSQDGLEILVSHQDQVVNLPSMGQVLAASQFCRNYMVEYDGVMLGIQGHPEFTRDYARDLMQYRQSVLPPNRVREALHSLSAPLDDRLVLAWIVNFLSQHHLR